MTPELLFWVNAVCLPINLLTITRAVNQDIPSDWGYIATICVGFNLIQILTNHP